MNDDTPIEPQPSPAPLDRPAVSPHAQPLGSFRSLQASSASGNDAPNETKSSEQSDDASPDNAPRFRPSRLATASTAVLWLALLASAALHTGAMVLAADRTFGFVDAGAFADPDRAIRIKRADFDVVISSNVTGLGGNDKAASVAEAEAVDDFLDDLVAPTPPSLEPTPPQLDLRPLEELRLDELAAEPAPALPGFEIDPALLETLADTAPEEAALVTGTGLAGRKGDDAGGDDLTAALLAGSVGSSVRNGPGGVGGGGTGLIRPGSTTAGNTDLLDRRPPPRVATPDDRRAIAEAPAGPEIDFAGLALGPTTELVFPEHLDDDFAYTLTVTPDPQRPADPAYFRVQIEPRRSLRKLATLPKDFVFLIDTSSSIPQRWVDEVVLGVEQSLAGLNPGDRFNLVVFSDTLRVFRPEAVSPTPALLGQAKSFLRDAKSKGYTDVNAALRQLLRRDLPPGRVYTLVLISDGKPTVGVVDARQLINLITRENDRVAGIYCVGVGPKRRLDPRLLDFLAYRNNGYSTLVTDRGRVAETIRDLASTLRYPLITDVQVRVAGDHAFEVYPRQLPTIHQGQAFSVYGRYDAAKPLTMQITGRAQNGRPVDFTFTRDPATAADAGPGLASTWAFWKLHELYSEVLRLGEQPGLIAQVRELRERYDLDTLY